MTADDDEITFDPDDVITNIEQVDEGWWMGTTSSGENICFFLEKKLKKLKSNFVDI